MVTSIDKALAGLILAFLAQWGGITPDMTIQTLVETFTHNGFDMLGKSSVFAAAVWGMPNKKKGQEDVE